MDDLKGFIGLDAANWNVLTPMLEAGELPNIAGLVREKVSGLVAIGESTDTILGELGPLVGESQTADSIEDAVRRARKMARPGDIVLLSPACASFDMFRDFEERGDRFRDLARALGDPS